MKIVNGEAYTNLFVSSCLLELASLLEGQHASAFRVRAYRNAAKTIESMELPLAVFLEQNGIGGLESLPGIGRSLARSIHSLATRGRLGYLQKLRGEKAAGQVLQQIPTIGPHLAYQIQETLGVDSFYELERAYHNGSLARVPGFGEKRLRAVAEFFMARRFCHSGDADHDISEILAIDKDYRHQATRGALPTILLQNSERGRSVPVLHTTYGSHHYTAMFSRSTTAIRLGHQWNWVVIHRDDPGISGQWTVVTEWQGSLKGHRVIRGLEARCASYYQNSSQSPESRRLHETATLGPAPPNPA